MPDPKSPKDFGRFLFKKAAGPMLFHPSLSDWLPDDGCEQPSYFLKVERSIKSMKIHGYHRNRTNSRRRLGLADKSTQRQYRPRETTVSTHATQGGLIGTAQIWSLLRVASPGSQHLSARVFGARRQRQWISVFLAFDSRSAGKSNCLSSSRSNYRCIDTAPIVGELCIHGKCLAPFPPSI